MAMSPPTRARMGSLPAVRRHQLLAEFTGLKQACPQGIYVSLTPGDPSLWSGVMFLRKGPYSPAILRFHISFPDTYPALPPLVTFSTDMFHPLITPLTTHMYSADVQDGGTASASEDERLPPGGFNLRHGFPAWFGRGSRARAMGKERERERERGAQRTGEGAAAAAAAAMTPTRAVATVATGTTPGSAASGLSAASSSTAGFAREVSTYEVLRYIRSTFDDGHVLDSVPLEAAGNPGAWHAWRTYRRHAAGKSLSGQGEAASAERQARAATDATPAAGPPATTKRPEEWNWEGVWEERVRRGIAASLSEGVLYGHAGAADEVINFLSMDEAEVEMAKSNLLRTLGAAA